MRRRGWAVVFAVTVGLAGCGGPDTPAAVAFTRVDPAGAEPVTLTPFGDSLLIGIRRGSTPGLLRRDPTGAITEIPTHGSTPYGQLARWTSIATDGTRIVAVGGERGGAHGNVRWSVWDGDTTALTEHRQGFSVFGGYGAGDLLGPVVTPTSATVLGSWESTEAGFDVAVWTPDPAGLWNRHPSTDTPLASSTDTLSFPVAATRHAQGTLIVGWLYANGTPQPAAWHSPDGTTDWTRTVLPSDGQSAALAVTCTDTTCVAAGRADNKLALWRLTGTTWTRLPDTPTIQVGDEDVLAPPLLIGDAVIQVIPDNGKVKLLRYTGDTWTTRDTDGPSGPVTAATVSGAEAQVIAGGALWRTEIAALG
ncbi:hypothetical protein [Actinokineospora enzanensis]|uniref:hypothetical protein n=1 Tax=Actinokineospora enzanensis TaxID=155975 RepID=UPI00036C37F2|nr:hypothetical protein [Actinokineospora enzanensis]